MTARAGAARRGRRPGTPDTRRAILAAARQRFAEVGYAGASVRAIAASAGVDAALVHHYFGTKDDLFVASLALPVDPRALLESVAEGDLATAGERLVRAFVAVWEDPTVRSPLLVLLRGAFDGPERRLLGEGVVPRVILPLGVALGLDEPERRMSLVASQVLGLVVTRYVLELPHVVAMDADELVATYAPTVQRYLTGRLPPR